MLQSDTCIKQKTLANKADDTRVFFALWPAPEIQRKLHTVAKAYQAKCDARVMHTESLHMTLVFIGNIKRSQLPKLIKAADEVSGLKPFQLELSTLSFWKHNRIGYAALAETIPLLDMLAAKLRLALANENIAFDNATRFSPHVTLLRNLNHFLEPQSFTPIRWPINTFALVESILSSQGARYRILKEWSLDSN